MNLSILNHYLPWGMSGDDALMAAAALDAIITILVIWNGLLVRDPTGARIREMSRRRDSLMSDLRIAQRHSTRAKGIGFMHQVVSKLKLLGNDKARGVADKLARAGLRSRDALITYLFVKLILPACFGGIAGFYFYGIGVFNLAPLMRMAAVMASMVFGAFLPDIYIKNIADKRRNKIRKNLPDALDLMVICAEAGLSLDAALKRVAKEMALSSSETADEFGLTSVEIGFLPERGQALRNLMRRCDLPGIRGVVNTLLQSEKYGTPLAQSLRVLSAEYRNERLMRAEEKAAKLPAILTVPMILFVLPPLFIVLIGPGILRFVDSMKGLSIPH